MLAACMDHLASVLLEGKLRPMLHGYPWCNTENTVCFGWQLHDKARLIYAMCC